MERIVPLMEVRDAGRLFVNPAPPWTDLLWRASLDEVDKAFGPDRFPILGAGRDLLVKVGNFNTDVYSDDVLTQAKAVGLEPFDTVELLAFAERENDLPNGHQFAALGAVGQLVPGAKLHVPYLEVKEGQRFLRLASLHNEKWDKFTRFLFKQIV